MLCSRFSLVAFSIIMFVSLSSILYFSDDLPGLFHAIKNSAHSISKTSPNTTAPVTPSLKDVSTTSPSHILPEPRILLVSMLFGKEDIAIYRRCLETHSDHGKRWGYETHVLGQAMRTGKYYLLNKTLYILSFLLTEMAKKADERAEWIVYVRNDQI